MDFSPSSQGSESYILILINATWWFVLSGSHSNGKSTLPFVRFIVMIEKEFINSPYSSFELGLYMFDSFVLDFKKWGVTTHLRSEVFLFYLYLVFIFDCNAIPYY
jgi:hypothetical protein